MTKTYAEKLLDPRWQKRRLHVLERDGWQCVECGWSEETLHVHHAAYTGEPWDAPDEALRALCATCHEAEHLDPQLMGLTGMCLDCAFTDRDPTKIAHVVMALLPL